MALDTIELIRNVAQGIPGVSLYGTNAIRARKTGPHILVDIKITVDGNLSASSAHQLGEHTRLAVMKEVPLCKEVRVHVDPSLRQEFDSVNDVLLDPPSVVETKIRSTLLFHIPELVAVPHVIVNYRHDARLLVKVTICVDPNYNIAEATEIGHACRAVLLKKSDISNVDVALDLDFSRDMKLEVKEASIKSRAMKKQSLRMVKLDVGVQKF